MAKTLKFVYTMVLCFSLFLVAKNVDGKLYFYFGLIALLDPYLSKSCGYRPLTNLNTKQPLMF